MSGAWPVLPLDRIPLDAGVALHRARDFVGLVVFPLDGSAAPRRDALIEIVPADAMSFDDRAALARNICRRLRRDVTPLPPGDAVDLAAAAGVDGTVDEPPS